MFFSALIVFAFHAFAQDTAESHLSAGIAFKAKGDTVNAAAELRSALELNPRLNAAHFYLAEILLAGGRPKESIDELRRVPRSASVDHLLGLAYLETGSPERAAEFFAHPTNAEGHYYLGIALGQTGELPAALREFKTAVALQPNFGPAHESLGLALRRQGDQPAALREFQSAARYMPKNPATLYDLGLALKGAGKWDQAEEAFRAALELKPDFERARYALGIVLRIRGNVAGAVSQMNQVRASHDKRTIDAQVHKLLFEGSEAALEQAIALDPSNAEAHMRLGILRARAQDNEAALEELHIAVAADPDSPVAHYNLAKLLSLLGHGDDSLRELQESLAIDPSQLPARMLLGNLYAERNDIDRAAAAFHEILRRDPSSSEAHNNLGLLWLNSGKKDLAAQEFRTALQLKPDFQSAQYNLNLALQP